MKVTDRQKEVVSALFNKVYNNDKDFRKEYDRNQKTMTKQELALWAAGYILKVTPEPDRYGEVHKVKF